MNGRYEDPEYREPRGRHAGQPRQVPPDTFDARSPYDGYGDPSYGPPQGRRGRRGHGGDAGRPGPADQGPQGFGGSGQRPRPGYPALPGGAQPGGAQPRQATGPQQQARTGPQQQTRTGPQQRYGTGPQRQFQTGPQQQYPTGSQQQYPTGPQQQYPTGPQARFRGGPQSDYPGGPQPGHPSGPQPQYAGDPRQGYPGGPQQFPSGSQRQMQTGPQQQYPGGPQQFPSGPQQQYPGGPQRGPAGGSRRRRRDEADDWEDSSFFSTYNEDDEDGDDDRPRRKRRGARRLAPWIALLVIVLPLGALGFFGYRLYMNKYHPADYSGAGYGGVTVHVPPGSTATGLGPELQQLGVVASSRAFVLAAEHYSGPGQMEPGYFKLQLHMQASLAYAVLINPKNMIQTRVTLPEGLRSSNVLIVLGQKTTNSLADYQAAFKNTAKLGLPAYAKGSAEGYLFPSTYQIQPGQSALQVLQTMVSQYNQVAASLHLNTAASSVGMTPGQLMIVASLVQAEGGTLQDYPKVAEVVYNRLRIGMKLQFDSAVMYGLNKYGTRASTADLAVNTPYNTYMHTGLPPTPIDNPGQAAIEAALKPATGNNYLYFCSRSQSNTQFSANPMSC